MPPPMILPKGIVLNHDHIYKQVAAYSHIPPEQVFEFWHVYTTTCRTLIDPTAQRLENFWWHVLGSDRRDLSGKTLARLFEDISKGPTFVRLRGPPNRYEGPSPPPSPAPQPVALVSAQTAGLPEDGQDVPATGRDEAAKPYQPSSSRPPPSHPILKKPRGPSTSGPRPTARFASPPESEEDESSFGDGKAAPPKAADAKTTGNSTAKEERRKASAVVPKKKAGAFVASTASKRRPAMPRRQSSQSSATAGSEVGSKDGSSSASSRIQGAQRPAAPTTERAAKTSTTKTNGVSEKPTSKPGGRRVPARSLSGTSNSKLGNSQGPLSRDRSISLENAAVIEAEEPTTDLKGKQPVAHRDSRGSVTSAEGRQETQGPKRAGAAPSMNRVKSDGGVQGRALPHGLTSLSTATTTTVAAQGTMTDFDESSPALTTPGGLHGAFSNSPYGSQSFDRSPLDPKFTPTPPSSAPSVPLARSKSQLTLLLERQNEKKPRR